MSTKGIRDFRPEIHFTPASGWINDPNGLVYENGNYHLFAQYYPEPQWGPMHWYHAVSKDKLHWEHLPVALAPDDLGFIFSGSAVYDAENTSGFGTKENPPIVAMFTSHGEHEQQSIAYSTDYVHFEKYEGNPVIPNTELKDFRDPKVFPNPVNGGWTVVMAAGDRVMFYGSENLREWHKTGEFGPEGNHSAGVWECPDCFPLTIDGEEKWILLVSMGGNKENHGARTQYFIGKFDGNAFICDTPFDQAEFIDQSFDNYAGVTFHNTAERTLIAWGTSWVYARDVPTGEFCGNMTLPRTLSLTKTPKGGLRLTSTPVTPFGEGKPCDGSLPGELFKLTAKGTGAATISFKNEKGQHFDFGVNADGEIFIDRTSAGANDFNADFASEWFSKISAPRYYDGQWELELIFDHSVTELFADQYTRAFTQVLYPDTPYTSVSVTSGKAELTISTVK